MAIKRVASAGQNVTYDGTVKSWNGSKGFGFITSPSCNGDIMFSRLEMPEDVREVRGKFLEGQAVFFELKIEADGRAKATSIRLQAGEYLAGAIKTYSAKNGYGFISCSALAEEVRFNTVDLPPTLAIGHENSACLKGELVIFKTQAAPLDGKLRIVGGLRFQSNRIAEKLKMQLGGGVGVGAPMQGFGKGGGFGGNPAGVANFGGMTTGVVKSFSDKNGWGFISIPGMDLDIKFDRQTPGVGAASLQAGTSVQLAASLRPGGQVQATQVLVVGAEGFGGGKGGAKRPAPKFQAAPTKKPKLNQTAQEGPWADGIVKSFNEGKGFGFITSTLCDSDIYFMRTDMAEMVPGQSIVGARVSFQQKIKPDGNVAAQTVAIL